MKPTNQQIDKAVALTRGWTIDELRETGIAYGPHYRNRVGHLLHRTSEYTPSTDIAQAWELVEVMAVADVIDIELRHFPKTYRVVVGMQDGVHADTAPRAICLAYLASKGYDSDEKIEALACSSEEQDDE